MDHSFKYLGAHEARADDHGSVCFTEKFRSLWPGKTLWATVDLLSEGLVIACYESLPDQEAYKEHRRGHYERVLRGNKKDPAEARRAALIDVINYIHFSQVPIQKKGEVQLGALLRRAQMKNPLVWTGMTGFNGIDGVVLQQQADLDRMQAAFAEEHKDDKRLLWPY